MLLKKFFLTEYVKQIFVLRDTYVDYFFKQNSQNSIG
jgi:hypothetical protein